MTGERFGFGKHYGKTPAEVPSGYLAWVLAEVRDLDHWLRRAIEQELAHRDAEDARRADERAKRARAGHGRRRAAATATESSLAPMIVRDWYGQMAREFHPDRGGSSEAMAAVNRGRDLLAELIGAGA